MESKYNPTEIEARWYQYWLDNKLFHSEPDGREPYTIVIPPPNVTGVLHMGHVLNETIQDILVRRARLEGKNACWVPGTDHASIATEAKVIKRLKEQGINKSDLTREQFLKHAWDWTDEHGGIILKQLRKLGCSCDWDRTSFTMDETRSKAVIKVFCDLYNKGLIYRGLRMVNWDPERQTALSDEEVIYHDEHNKFYYLRYEVAEEPGKYAIVATTRPETIFGDIAVCINPKEEKNQWLKGKHVIVPGVGRVIPIIEDRYVEIGFGTGCLKVTPAHDVNDYALGQKYNLKTIDIFTPDAHLNMVVSSTAKYDDYIGPIEEMDNHGIRKEVPLTPDQQKGEALKLKIDVLGVIEAGYEMAFSNKGKPGYHRSNMNDQRLRIGAFAEMGILNITPKTKKALYDVPASSAYDFQTFTYNHVLSTGQIGSTHNFFAGIRITYFFFGVQSKEKCLLCDTHGLISPL